MLPQKALAHEFATSGTTGVVLHIEPDDAPKANESSLLQIDITDTANKFSVGDCDCKIQILRAKKSVYSTNLSEKSSGSSLVTFSVEYAFPKPGEFEVVVVGSSKSHSFMPFSIPFRVKVDSGISFFQIALMFGVLVAFFGTIFVILQFLVPKKHKTRSDG